jgi:hypothetical protein
MEGLAGRGIADAEGLMLGIGRQNCSIWSVERMPASEGVRNTDRADYFVADSFTFKI